MKTAAAPARRGRPRDPAADTRIRAAAAELLLERGFERMTVDDVALKAHVGKATVYRRWESKEALAYDALAHLVDHNVPHPDHEGTIEANLAQVYSDLIEFLGNARGTAFLRIAASESGRDERIGRLYRTALDQHLEQAREVFAVAVSRGEVRSDVDVRATVEGLIGTMLLRAITGTPMPTADDVPGLVALTLDGIRSR
ncbi:TetR/AcrR family transcriptional regulator [Tenggerimyces flavus]|uniref:TetR/AcrR family transcriptional regulator n=1 Tax=Tenggerimyces flavus TaxID=1708749 RepID=A0ABV7YIY9_9ACTN|nr:TetR/AcrR family transcriptional regulator [Tenggerimyces flavus]MBM7786729.1 AcrR family transcriptional regulator [Tenggerimyces flavus]